MAEYLYDPKTGGVYELYTEEDASNPGLLYLFDENATVVPSTWEEIEDWIQSHDRLKLVQMSLEKASKEMADAWRQYNEKRTKMEIIKMFYERYEKVDGNESE